MIHSHEGSTGAEARGADGGNYDICNTTLNADFNWVLSVPQTRCMYLLMRRTSKKCILICAHASKVL